MRKAVIVITYKDRNFQLNKTLETIYKTNHDNFEVVIVDDASEEEVKLNNSLKYYSNIHTIKISKEDKKGFSPVVAYNKAIEYAFTFNPEIIFFTERRMFSYRRLTFICQ